MPIEKPAEATPKADPAPIDTNAAAAAAKAFLDVVSASRGKIQECYATARQQNPALGATTITITAKFLATGESERVLITPFVTQDFEGCVQAIATTWRLSLTQPMTFKANASLTP